MNIDVSAYKTADKVTVKNRIHINNHITLFVELKDIKNKAVPIKEIFKQTYDFLQQDGFETLETLGVNVKQGSLKRLMFTVNVKDFVPRKNKVSSIKKASLIEFKI